MKAIRTFIVTPSLPAALEGLRALAHNLRWAWNHDAIELFRRLDSDLWEATGHNPVGMLGTIAQTKLEAAAADEGFLAHLERVSRDFEAYLASKSTWFNRAYEQPADPLVAYFSAEFGVTECLSIFAGGLGLLAGDHLKSASDLGLPLVGVGLLYQEGYLRQRLNQAGWQQEAYTDNDFRTLPLTLERNPDDTSLTVQVAYPGRMVTAQIWRAQVGRVALYLLDTNIPANRPEDRDITDQLYGGDLEMRLKQEMMLGIGGFRACQALGLHPLVYHMNEGHAAFLALEHVRHLIESCGATFDEARATATAGLIFTTHTPVPAGHDHFSPELMDRYLGDYARSLGLSRYDFLALGRQDPQDEGSTFSMTVLALRMSAYSNGVSRLHGQVSRQMMHDIWPGVPESEIPIGHVTNGVHFRTWISYELNQLYDRYLGPRWTEEPADRTVWQRVERIPTEELWRTHERRRERLTAFARRRLRTQLEQSNASPSEIEAADEVLNPEALTIGFARRFATYKRATLLLRDPDRLLRILNNPQRPVQIIFAGKAHPRDDEGKELIKQIVSLARQEAFRRYVVFLEDYDIAVARYLVQGCDVWLNTPRRPLEASGTSGMKAMANGALNLSVLDGWWDEAWSMFDPHSTPIGWAIGGRDTFSDQAYQDQIEAEALYALLERDVVPTFYERGANGLPRRWIARMKASIGILSPFFNTHRMVQEYTERFYLPAATSYRKLTADGIAGAKALAAWQARVRQAWSQIRIEVVEAGELAALQVGREIQVRARVRLGGLTPDDVRVELLVGRVNADDDLVEVEATPLQSVGSQSDSLYIFEARAVPCRTSGLHGYTLRVLPHHPELTTPFQPGLIVWAQVK
jgi:starch phosphorylase